MEAGIALRDVRAIPRNLKKEARVANYWKNIYETVSRDPEYSLLEQVGKTLNGKPLPEDQIQLIVQSAVRALQLAPRDFLIDLCCGNGLITERIAPLVDRARAVDFSEGLIEVAKANSHAANIEYECGDILNLGTGYFSSTRKILMNESLQHFVPDDLGVLLDQMIRLDTGSLVYFGGIPDLEKLAIYYDTPEKMAFYEMREREGRPHSGKWWLRSQISKIAADRGFKVTIVPQNSAMVTSYYRFDVLLSK